MDSHDELLANSRQNLVDFLNVELDFGFTLVRTATIEADWKSDEGRTSALRLASEAVSAVHKFPGQHLRSPRAAGN